MPMQNTEKGFYAFTNYLTEDQLNKLVNEYSDHDAFRLFLLESVVSDKVWILEHNAPLREWAEQLARKEGLSKDVHVYVCSIDSEDENIAKGDFIGITVTAGPIEEKVEHMEFQILAMLWHRLFVESLQHLSKVNGQQAACILDKVLALVEEIKKCKEEE
jgi:hypothetical protein